LVLSPQEKAELESLSRRLAAPRRAVERARIVLLAAQNTSIPAIATRLQVSANTVRKWIRRYTRKPLESPATENSAPQPPAVEPPPSKLPLLADAPRSGRPDTFSAQQTCALVAIACEKPEDHGRPITHWTARELKDQVVQQGIVSSISERQVNRMLAALDLQPHRSRYWLNAKPDPQKEETIRVVCARYQQAQEAATRGELDRPDLPITVGSGHMLRMSKLMDIEQASVKLPAAEQRQLLRFLLRVVPVADAELPALRQFTEEEIHGWLAEDEASMRRFREGK
jgi:transposase